jgi:hypothetical protein
MAKYNKIEFGNSYGYEILNADLKQLILNQMKTEFNEIAIIPKIKSINKYYKLLSSDEIKHLQNRRFICSYNYKLLDSVYYYSTKINDIKYNLFIINDKIIHTNIFYNINKDFILEGRIYEDKFIINDIFINEEFTTFLDKLKYINSLLITNYFYSILKDPYKFILDIFIDYKYLNSLFINKLIKEEFLNGIIFKDINFINKDKHILNYVYIYNKSNIYEKIKDITIDISKSEKQSNDLKLNTNTINIFKVFKTNQEDIYEIHYKNNKIDIADVPDLKTSIYLKSEFGNNKFPFLYFKCFYNKKTNRWHPFQLNLIKK